MRIRDWLLLLTMIAFLFGCNTIENKNTIEVTTAVQDFPVVIDVDLDMPDYTTVINEAIENGDVVNQLSGTSNVYQLHLFEAAFLNEEEAELKIMTFSVEGEPIQKTLIYHDNQLEVVQGIAGEIYFDDFIKTMHSDYITYELKKGTEKYPFISVRTDQPIDLAGVVIEAFEAALDIDPGLNHGMTYIAIDGKSLTELSEKEKGRVLKHFEIYDMPVKDASFEDLKNMDLVKEGNGIDGILLSVNKFNIQGDITLDVTKFKSGLGAIGVNCIFEKEKLYQLKEAKMTWIS